MDRAGAGVCALAFALYINTLGAGFVYDDSRAVLRNPDVSSPSSPWLSTLSHDFWGAPLRSSGSHGSYRPLSTLSLRLNAWLDPQLRPAGFHFLNAALHALASWLVLVLGRRLLGPGRSRWAAALAAHLFAAHPVHCEAVAGVVGRADLLCCVCYLLAVLCYLRHVDLRDQRRCRHASTATSRTARARDVPQPSKDIINAVLDRFLLAQEWSPCQPLQQPARRCGQCALRSGALLGAALLLAACATLCKEPGVTVLAVCCVYELLAQLGRRRAAKRPQWRGVLVLVGFSAVLLGARLALVLGRAPRFASADNPAAHSDSLATRTLTFLYLPVVNLRLLLWPYRLSFDWSMEAVPLVQSLWDPRNALSAALYLGLYRLVRVALGHLSTRTTTTTHVFRSGKHRRTTSTSSTASFSSCELTLMCVAVTVLPLLPCTNLFFYVGFVVAERVLYIPSVGFCLLVAVGARRLLDTESTATSPTPPRVVVNLAVLALLLAFSVRTVLRNYDWRDEEALYRSGVDVNPPKAYGNLGSVLSSLNRLSEAEHAFKMALKHRPNMADVHYNLGNLQAKQNQSTAAINSYKQAIRFRPSLALAYVNLGHVLAREGRVSEAVEVLVRCVELPVEGLRDPVAHQSARASALLHLAHVHAGQGNYHLAKSALQLALDIRPSEYQPAPLYELMAEVTDRLNHKPLVVSGTQSACPRTPSPGTSLTAAALPLNESHCGSTDTRRLLSYS